MNTTRKKIEITKISMQSLMQETYNDIIDMKNKAVSDYKKYSEAMTETTDMAMIGKNAEGALKLYDSAIEKKIKLISIQKEILYKKGEINSDPSVSLKFDDDDRKYIENEIKKLKENDGIVDIKTKEYE